MKPDKLETDIEKSTTEAPAAAAPVAAPAAPKEKNWLGGMLDQGGQYAAKNPWKSTAAAFVVADQVNERLVSPAIDKVVEKISSTFGTAANEAVSEKFQEEAVAQATGTTLNHVASKVLKGFAGVKD